MPASFHETLLLPSPLQWAVRVLAVALVGVIVFGLLTQTLAVWEQALGLALGVGIPVLLMTVRGEVAVKGGQLNLALRPFWSRRIDVADVVSAHNGDVDPLPEIGVLGLGRRGGRTVLALRKGTAVHLSTRGGEHYTVGVDDPAALLGALGSEPA